MVAACTYRLVALLPPLTACVALFTIITCAQLTFAADVLPAEIGRFPPISLFGVGPESAVRLYRVGFPLVAAMFFAALTPVGRFITARVEPAHRDEARKVVWTSVVAFLGLAIHGIVPLHPHIVYDITQKRAPPADPHALLSPAAQNGIHQLAAAVFFMMSLYHGFTVTQLYSASKKLPFNGLSLGLKYVTLYAQFAPAVFSLLLHPATKQALGLDVSLGEQDKAGLSQWWTVGCLIVFYVTYSVDLLNIASVVSAETTLSKKKK